MSDRNWLGIIRRDWKSRTRQPRSIEPERLGQVSVEMFARDLGRMTSLQPVRFARLALRMPADCDPRYPVAILQSLAERNPPTELASAPPIPRHVTIRLVSKPPSLRLDFRTLSDGGQRV